MNRNTYLKGKKVNDLLELNTSRMSVDEIRAVVTRLNSAANKRIKSLEKSGFSTPALRAATSNQTKFSTKGMIGAVELKNAYYRVRDFLKSETSTVKGYKAVQKRTIKELEKRGVRNITPAKLDEMWTIYDRLAEIDPQVTQRAVKYKVMDEISRLITETTMSADEIIAELTGRANEIYERNQQYYEEQFSSPFSISYDELFKD